MGCASSVAVPIKSSIQLNSIQVANNDEWGFTDRQKTIVRKTWKLLATDLTGRGIKVFTRIFEIQPDLKQLFSFRNAEGEAMLKDTRFKGHASRFMNSVGAVVDNLDNLSETLKPLLTELGMNHVNFQGFEPEYFNVFFKAMNQVWAEDLGSKFTAEAQEAWTLVFSFIMDNLKLGFAMAKQDEM